MNWRGFAGAALFAALVASVLAVAPAVFAQSPLPSVPGFWRIDKFRAKPAIPEGTKIRFVTTADYPPFNYRDESGTLTGFNIEIARAICSVLDLQCSFKVRRWSQLIPALERGAADAIVASLAISARNRRRLSFSDRYYLTPALFAVRLESKLQTMTPKRLAGRKVAVIEGTSHEAFLRAFFGRARIVKFAAAAEAREALRIGKVDAVFGDGMSLMYWLAGTASRKCCRFAGGPFTESRYFGEGVGIAVAKGNQRLVDILNYGLDRIRVQGSFENIFLRYFPTKMY